MQTLNGEYLFKHIKFLVLLFSINLLSAQFNSLEIQNVDVNAGTFDLYMENSEDLAGFQIHLLVLPLQMFQGVYLEMLDLCYLRMMI